MPYKDNVWSPLFESIEPGLVLDRSTRLLSISPDRGAKHAGNHEVRRHPFQSPLLWGALNGIEPSTLVPALSSSSKTTRARAAHWTGNPAGGFLLRSPYMASLASHPTIPELALSTTPTADRASREKRGLKLRVQNSNLHVLQIRAPSGDATRCILRSRQTRVSAPVSNR